MADLRVKEMISRYQVLGVFHSDQAFEPLYRFPTVPSPKPRLCDLLYLGSSSTNDANIFEDCVPLEEYDLDFSQ